MVPVIIYRTVKRYAIKMHIQRRHKNGNLYALIVEEFVFNHFFDHYNFPVGRGYNRSFFDGNAAAGTSEKLPEKEKQSYRAYQEQPEKPFRHIGLQPPVKRNQQYSQDNEKQPSFAVNGHG